MPRTLAATAERPAQRAGIGCAGEGHVARRYVSRVARHVVTPERVRWRVGRRWLPFRVRLRRQDWREVGPTDLSEVALFESPAGILAGLAVIAAAMVLLLVVWPLVAIAIELVILALVLMAALVGRVLFRRPWTIYATSKDGERAREHTWRVVGWRRSSRLIEEARRALEHGAALPPGATTDGPPPVPLPRLREPASG